MDGDAGFRSSRECSWAAPLAAPSSTTAACSVGCGQSGAGHKSAAVPGQLSWLASNLAQVGVRLSPRHSGICSRAGWHRGPPRSRSWALSAVRSPARPVRLSATGIAHRTGHSRCARAMTPAPPSAGFSLRRWRIAQLGTACWNTPVTAAGCCRSSDPHRIDPAPEGTSNAKAWARMASAIAPEYGWRWAFQLADQSLPFAANPT